MEVERFEYDPHDPLDSDGDNDGLLDAFRWAAIAMQANPGRCFWMTSPAGLSEFRRAIRMDCDSRIYNADHSQFAGILIIANPIVKERWDNPDYFAPTYYLVEMSDQADSMVVLAVVAEQKG